MSDEFDWARPCILHSRSDTGSEMYFDFEKLDEGPLSAMIARVVSMTPADRSRVIVDVPGKGNLTVGEVLALAERPDFPTI
ncbi:hypothetical protein [Sphingomonas sp.]|uniref:hypothetical protein n=1 Tax=Sphingomonas sp. TaxID=28214 RepID=UPI000DB277B4|nr:hypothetical protein [Sphingomonas sp.]PZU08541.1 MAG: hypothetical protein DI605_11240 [Sphingomonas sp.]